MPVNIPDFLDTSDAPSDKIGAPQTGSFSALARYGSFQPRRTVATVPHTFAGERVPDGIWSRDQVSWYPFGVTPPDTSGAQPTFQTTEVDVCMDASNIYVICSNYTASAVTIYYIVEPYSRG